MAALVKLASAQQPIGQIIFFRKRLRLHPALHLRRRAGGFPSLRTRYVRQHVVRVIAGIASMALIFSAFAVMPLADVVAPRALGPDLPHQPVSAECWARRSVAALERVGVGFIGILIITRPDSEVFDPVALVPLGGAVFYAVAMIQIRKVGTRRPAATMTFYYNAIAPPCSPPPACPGNG